MYYMLFALWIAFKFWLYWDWKQPRSPTVSIAPSCELLSNFGYIGIGNNIRKGIQRTHLVVNCFQILAILGLETTLDLKEMTPNLLWIAFKFWLYWDWKQPHIARCRCGKCCELLSNFGYIGIGNNQVGYECAVLAVVNCFQILAILGLETTLLRHSVSRHGLWIAFKFWLYWDWKQQYSVIQSKGFSCELLSNFGYIGIGNNPCTGKMNV